MKISISRKDNDYKMEAVNETGNTIIMDGPASIGGHEQGFRPMQLLLAALGGCATGQSYTGVEAGPAAVAESPAPAVAAPAAIPVPPAGAANCVTAAGVALVVL